MSYFIRFICLASIAGCAFLAGCGEPEPLTPAEQADLSNRTNNFDNQIKEEIRKGQDAARIKSLQ
jgi:hypothetical protein